MNAVDTNILIYVHDPREPQKQAIATALVQSLSDGVLLWQVACEYLAASRKLQAYGYRPDDAWQDIEDLRSVWTSVFPTGPCSTELGRSWGNIASPSGMP